MAKITYKPTGIFVDDVWLSLTDIQKECTKVRLAEMKSKDVHLMTIEWKGFRHMDDICEMIVLPMKNIEMIKSLIIGKTINFGEINGKHSEVYGILKEEHLTLSKKKKDILEFLLECPDGHDYNYSFLYTFREHIADNIYSDITRVQIVDFDKALTN